jgi:hypothetical protein
MPICGHPTKNGTPCKRVVPFCWQHRRWRIGAAFVVSVLSVLSFFIETPRLKVGFGKHVSNTVPTPPTGLSAVVTYPDVPPSVTPPDQILTPDSAAAKADHPSTKVIQPSPPRDLKAVVQ